jgi:REP element-mobilizing transposase RayT
MPDHVHLILCPVPCGNEYFSIPEIMKTIKSESAHRINQVLSRTGRVWQDESFDHLLRRSESLDAKTDYIIENPVRAGLVRVPSEYRWVWRYAGGKVRSA